MYDLRVIVAAVYYTQLDIRTCTAQIVHKLYSNVSMMLWSPSSGKKSTTTATMTLKSYILRVFSS